LEGSARQGSLVAGCPHAIAPHIREQLASGRIVHEWESAPIATDWRGGYPRFQMSSKVAPRLYIQGILSLRTARSSPPSALMGTHCAQETRQLGKSEKILLQAEKHVLPATTRFQLVTTLASSEYPAPKAMMVCAGCGSKPLVASTRITNPARVRSRSHVAMFLVYSSWPGVSAMMNFLRR